MFERHAGSQAVCRHAFGLSVLRAGQPPSSLPNDTGHRDPNSVVSLQNPQSILPDFLHFPGDGLGLQTHGAVGTVFKAFGNFQPRAAF